MRVLISTAGFLVILAIPLALAEERYDRPPDTSQPNLQTLLTRSATAVKGLELTQLFVDDATASPPGFEVSGLANQMATRLEVRMDSADLRDVAEEQNALAENLAARVAASTKNLKPEFQPPTFQCLAAFYECKAFLATKGESQFSVEFGCGFTYLFCMAERVIPLAGG